MATRSVLTEKKLRQQLKSSEPRTAKVILYLSRQGRESLEELRLRALDRRGRKPSASDIIEALLKTALGDEKIPYPAV